MTTNPGGMQYPDGPPPPAGGAAGKSSRGRIIAIIAAVVALVAAVAVGRATVSRETVQPAAAPAPVTVTAKPSTVTKTVTSTAAPVTVTAAPTTVTAPPVSVTATATVTEAAAGPTATVKNGINLVGVDVQPGTYRSDGANCYWARLSGTSGTLDDIIANSNGPTVVTIDPSDVAFESRYCAPWTQVS